MWRSLRARLLVAFVVPLLASGAVALYLVVRDVNRAERDQNVEQLQRQAAAIAVILSGQAKNALKPGGGGLKLRDPIRRLSDANVYYASNPRANFSLPLEGFDEIRLPFDWALIDRGRSQTIDGVDPTTKERVIAVASPIYLGADTSKAEGAIGAVVLARPVRTLTANPRRVARRVAPAFAIGTAIALALASAVGWGVTRPLRALAAAARSIGRGRYDVRLDRARRDEIGDVNRAFGEMVGRLRDADEQKRSFLMRVSHELRTPLTAIQGHVNALQDGIIDDEADRQASYGVIETEAARLERLVRELLDLARLEARAFTLRVEPVDLGAVVDECTHAHRQAARAGGVEVRCTVGDALVVDGDADRLRQVVGNLVENAIRWTPAGGTVDVSGRRAGGRVVVEVADSGPGVAPEERRRVFEPLYSGDGRGTGLGLAIAAELVGAMGGTIEVDAAAGGGALFRVSFAGSSARAAERALTPA